MKTRLYILSLAKNNPRREEIQARLQELGLDAIIWDAVDGRDGLGSWETEIDRKGSLRLLGRKMSDGEFACALGHREIYRDFVASDAEIAVILEDDAIIGDAFKAFIEQNQAGLAPMILLYHSNALVFKATQKVSPQHELRPVATSPFGTVAYSINRASAAALEAAARPVRTTADWPLDISVLGACAMVPMIVDHPPDDHSSTLSQKRSSGARPLSYYLSGAYLRRKWRKARSVKVS